MTYIITEPCVGLKEAACVDVCPVDCIYPVILMICSILTQMSA